MKNLQKILKVKLTIFVPITLTIVLGLYLTFTDQKAAGVDLPKIIEQPKTKEEIIFKKDESFKTSEERETKLNSELNEKTNLKVNKNLKVNAVVIKDTEETKIDKPEASQSEPSNPEPSKPKANKVEASKPIVAKTQLVLAQPVARNGSLVNQQAPSPVINNFDQNLNSYVLDIIKTYEIGNYPYLLNTDYANYNGVTTNIVYQGTTIARANPSGDKASHCVGITFEVLFKALQERNKKLGISLDDFNGMSAEELKDFLLIWFVSNGVKPEQNCSVAVEKYGIGKRITNFEDAKPGDFIDISRENNTGHTAVFLDWIRKNGKIVGLKYWSSQSSTKGIAYNEEYFNVMDENGTKLGNVMIEQVYIARVGSVSEYRPFK